MKSFAAGIFIIVITIIALLGFYPSYFSRFPEFEGLGFCASFPRCHDDYLIRHAHHVTFPDQLQKNGLASHYRQLSYVVAPLFAFYFFLATRNEYYEDVAEHSRERSLAGLDLDLMSLLSFVILYSLAVQYRKKNGSSHALHDLHGTLNLYSRISQVVNHTDWYARSVAGILIMVVTYCTYALLMVMTMGKVTP